MTLFTQECDRFFFFFGPTNGLHNLELKYGRSVAKDSKSEGRSEGLIWVDAGGKIVDARGGFLR